MRMGMLIFAACLFFTGITLAADEGPSAGGEWEPVSAGPVTTWTAPLCGKGKFVLQPFFLYTRTRGSFDEQGHYDGLLSGARKYQFQEQLFTQYGITDKLEVNMQAAYQQNYAKQDGIRAQSSGWADSYLFLRYCFMEENGPVPHIAGLVQLKAPTGKYQHSDPDKLGTDLMGGGSWDPGFGVIITKKMKPFLLHGDATYSMPQRVRIDGVKTRYADYFNYDLGVEYFLPKGFNLLLEANGYFQGDIEEDGGTVPASDSSYLVIAPGIGWSNDNIQMVVAYQRTVTGFNTDANDAVVATFVYTF